VENALTTHRGRRTPDVPNEPLQFADETRTAPKTASSLQWISIKTGDETWPLRLPMTKAAVRAMDTSHIHGDSPGGRREVEKFVVSADRNAVGHLDYGAVTHAWWPSCRRPSTC